MLADSWRFEILQNIGSDRIRWNDLLGRIQNKDIYFMPEYMKLFENAPTEVSRNFGGEAILAYYGNDDLFIVYPFFKRPVHELNFYETMPLNYGSIYDIISPWYYSGILIHSTNEQANMASCECLVNYFLKEFHEYCTEQNIIAEFMRLHPFIKNDVFDQIISKNSKKSGDVVYVDLSQDTNAIFKNINKSNRNCISKSLRKCVKVYKSQNKTDLNIFYQLYTSTMEHVDAEKRYYFPKSFFNEMFNCLGDSATLFIAEYNGKPIASSIFLNKYGFVHYYLSGSDPDYRKLCPTNLLLWEAIIWAKKQEYKIFEFGGGHGEGSSLYKFKSSFSKNSVDFYTYTKIHDEKIYQILCDARDEYDRINEFQPKINSEYFPAYRK